MCQRNETRSLPRSSCRFYLLNSNFLVYQPLLWTILPIFLPSLLSNSNLTHVFQPIVSYVTHPLQVTQSPSCWTCTRTVKRATRFPQSLPTSDSASTLCNSRAHLHRDDDEGGTKCTDSIECRMLELKAAILKWNKERWSGTEVKIWLMQYSVNVWDD